MYSSKNPYCGAISKRKSLCAPASHKNTFHVELGIEGSGIEYQVGDSIGILPHHDEDLVTKTLASMSASGDEEVQDRAGNSFSLRQFLTEKAAITTTNKKLWQELSDRLKGKSGHADLERLLQKEHRDELKSLREGLHLWEVLELFKDAKLPPKEVCRMLSPLLPRLYSIASSPLIHPDEIHLTVALVEYKGVKGVQRKGVCTNFLNQVSEGVSLYLQPHKGFSLPEDPKADLIMVGPGTGVAPFRAFMQERVTRGDTGRNWLFFGECHRDVQFFYEEEWEEWVKMGKLNLDLAFSRDQAHKVYVHHKMKESSRQLFDWLENGAYFYVCGDAKKMAKDVEATLKEVLVSEGAMNEENASEYVKKLRKEGRYLRDVY